MEANWCEIVTLYYNQIVTLYYNAFRGRVTDIMLAKLVRSSFRVDGQLSGAG